MKELFGCEVCRYDEATEGATVVCLGFFDCVHNGHRRVIETAKNIAKSLGAKTAAFTFRSDPHAALGSDRKEIYTFDERALRMSELGVDEIFFAEPSADFFKVSAVSFLHALTSAHNIVGIVAGSDYTYGAGASGNAESLRAACRSMGIRCIICDMLEYAPGKKIASRMIEKCVQSGDITTVNGYLTAPYLVLGQVVRGRAEGHKHGFPTANLVLPPQKLALSRGVYATLVTVDGVKLRAVTNVGEHPTFGDYKFTVESYIIGWSGDLYGKTIAVEFLQRIREIRAFDDPKELKAQIDRDVEFALGNVGGEK